MIDTYWFLYVWNAIEIEVRGPFVDSESRDAAAQAYVKEQRRGDDDSTAPPGKRRNAA